jgi:hypothetical protein
MQAIIDMEHRIKEHKKFLALKEAVQSKTSAEIGKSCCE